MSHLDVLLAARAATTREAQRRRAVRQRYLAEKPMVMVPFQPGGEAHTLVAIAWGDEVDAMHQLVIPQPLNRQQLFDGLAPLVDWFTSRFERAWEAGDWDDEAGAYVYDVDLLPQVICPNPAGVAALGRVGRRLAYLPTEPSDDPDAPPPAPEDLVRFGRVLRWLDGHALESGQNLILDVVTMLQYHWVTVQSVTERAHLGALLGWIDPPDDLDPDDAADEGERLSIGPYAVPSDEHPITDLIAEWGDAERAGSSTADLTGALETAWGDLLAPVWERCWRAIDLLYEVPEENWYLPDRRKADAKAYARELEWLDGPTGGRSRTRQTPRQAIWSKRMAEYHHGVLEAQEKVTDPLAMVDEILAGKAVRGRVVSVDVLNKEVKAGNTKASSVPVVVLHSNRPCRIPLGRKLWWDQDCGRVSGELFAVDNRDDGSAEVIIKVMGGAKDGGVGLLAMADAGETTCFSVYTTAQFFPGPLPEDDPFTHIDPTQVFGHIEAADGDVA